MIFSKDLEHTDVKLVGLQLRGSEWIPPMYSGMTLASRQAVGTVIVVRDVLNNIRGGQLREAAHFLKTIEGILSGPDPAVAFRLASIL